MGKKDKVKISEPVEQEFVIPVVQVEPVAALVAEAPPDDDMVKIKTIPSTTESTRMIKDLESKINVLKAIKTSKVVQLQEDAVVLTDVEGEMARIRPKLEAIKLVIDLKEKKRAAMQKRLEEQMGSILGLSTSTLSLVSKLRTSTRHLDRKNATEVTTAARGYNTKDSVYNIRRRSMPTTITHYNTTEDLSKTGRAGSYSFV